MLWGFPDGPVFKIPHFHSSEHGFKSMIPQTTVCDQLKQTNKKTD